MLKVYDIKGELRLLINEKSIISFNLDLRDKGFFRRLWINCNNDLHYDILLSENSVFKIMESLNKGKKVIKEDVDFELFKKYLIENNLVEEVNNKEN